MTGFEKVQHLSRCYQNSMLGLVGIGVVIIIIAALLYIQKKNVKVKGSAQKKQQAKILQNYRTFIGLVGIAVITSVIAVIPFWQDNHQNTFHCATGIYERDFAPVNWHRNSITITDDKGDVTSLRVAAGYFTEDGLFSSKVADKAFPEGTFRAQVYYGEHSGFAFCMEVIE